MSRGCKKDQHHDQRMRGGRHYRCTTCHDVFPCKVDCRHLDCLVATGRDLPDNVGPEAREALTVELTALYPDNAFAFAPVAAGAAAAVSTKQPVSEAGSDSAAGSEPPVPKLTVKQIAGLRTYARTKHWGDTHGKTIHSLERCGLIGYIDGVRQVTKLGHITLGTGEAVPDIFSDLFTTKGTP